MKSNIFALCFLAALMILLVILGAACTQVPTPPPDGRALIQQLETGVPTREAIEAELTQMNVPQLVETLQSESLRGVEPFNSLVYRELVSRGPDSGEELAASITKPDRSSFLSLLALRQIDGERYRSLEPDLGVSILVDALQTSTYFNVWGLPHLYWEDAAQAIIDYGPDAEASLRKLLDDDREALVWGSEEVMEAKLYNYRVKDYAWALLKEISGEGFEIPLEPEARDRLIEAEME